MAVSLADIALDLRLITAEDQAIPAGQAAIIQRAMNAASLIVTTRAPAAPVVLSDQAIISIASYLYDKPTAAPGNRYSNAWTNSGASSMLAAYVSRSARPIGTADATGGAAPGGDGTIGVDATARAQAAAALAAAQAAAAVAAGKITSDEAIELINSRILEITHDADVVDGIIDGRLPGIARVMRVGWSQVSDVSADYFVRADDHPIDGAALGTTDGTVVPPFPPALVDDQSLFMQMWVAGDEETVALELSDNFVAGENLLPTFPHAGELEVDGVGGNVYISDSRQYARGADAMASALLPGALIYNELNFPAPVTIRTYAVNFDDNLDEIRAGLTAAVGRLSDEQPPLIRNNGNALAFWCEAGAFPTEVRTQFRGDTGNAQDIGPGTDSVFGYTLNAATGNPQAGANFGTNIISENNERPVRFRYGPFTQPKRCLQSRPTKAGYARRVFLYGRPCYR